MIGLSVGTLLAATLALLIAFAWNDAATKSLQHVLPVRHHSDIVKITIIYALLITMFIIFIVCILNQTNKLYYTYTGKLFLDINNIGALGINSKILRFWKPKSDNSNKDNSNEDNSNEDNSNEDSSNEDSSNEDSLNSTTENNK